MSTTRDDATQTVDLERAARVEKIRNAVLVRAALTQAANHRRLSDGRHEITVYDHAAGRLLVFVGRTVEAAIRKARPG